VVNNVRYRCEVGHRLHKQYTSLAQQATLHHALAQARSSPSAASLSGASSGYAAGYAAGCASYGNAAAYYPQHPAPQFLHQAQGYPPQAPSPADAQLQEQQQQQGCYVYSPPAQQCSSPATTGYSPGTTSFTPTPMASQGIYGSRSPTAYELQLLAVQSPHVHVVTPQRMYANPRMAVSAAQQSGYLSGPLFARPLGTAHLFQTQQLSQYAPQSQYASQTQYVSQPQYVAQPQYSCQYMVPSAVTSPTQDYPEMGLRARSYTEGSDPGCNANMYLPVPQQQHAGYVAAGPHYSGTAMVASSPPAVSQMMQAQSGMYYVSQQQPAAQAPQVVYQYVAAPAAPVSATSAAPAVSQEEGEDPEALSPRSSVCMSCSSNEHLGMRPRANSGLAPPPSPVCEKARLLRFPQVGYAAHPAVVYVTPPGSARDAHQYMQSQCVYQDQQLESDAGAMTVSPTL
jgi:hypothetical protein